MFKASILQLLSYDSFQIIGHHWEGAQIQTAKLPGHDCLMVGQVWVRLGEVGLG